MDTQTLENLRYINFLFKIDLEHPKDMSIVATVICSFLAIICINNIRVI